MTLISFNRESSSNDLPESNDPEEEISSGSPSSSLSSEDEEEHEDEPSPKKRKRKASNVGSRNRRCRDRNTRIDDLYLFHPSLRAVPFKSSPSLCALCDISFSSKEEKFFHNETLHLAKPSPLSTPSSTNLFSRICGKSSMTPSDLSLHNEECHATYVNFICSQCQPLMIFFSEELLKAHQVIHESSYNFYECILCKQVNFDLAGDLESHLTRVHAHSLYYSSYLKKNRTGRECDNKSKKSLQSFPLEKKLICRFCGVYLKNKQLFGVRQHERTEHPEKFIHPCDSCNISYAEVNEARTCQETHKTKDDKSKPEETFKCFVCNLM